eukprot:4441811-Prymnesium_polylepis.1
MSVGGALCACARSIDAVRCVRARGRYDDKYYDGDGAYDDAGGSAGAYDDEYNYDDGSRADGASLAGSQFDDRSIPDSDATGADNLGGMAPAARFAAAGSAAAAAAAAAAADDEPDGTYVGLGIQLEEPDGADAAGGGFR